MRCIFFPPRFVFLWTTRRFRLSSQSPPPLNGWVLTSAHRSSSRLQICLCLFHFGSSREHRGRFCSFRHHRSFLECRFLPTVISIALARQFQVLSVLYRSDVKTLWWFGCFSAGFRVLETFHDAVFLLLLLTLALSIYLCFQIWFFFCVFFLSLDVSHDTFMPILWPICKLPMRCILNLCVYKLWAGQVFFLFFFFLNVS